MEEIIENDASDFLLHPMIGRVGKKMRYYLKVTVFMGFLSTDSIPSDPTFRALSFW
jgi:hypothetical protein